MTNRNIRYSLILLPAALLWGGVLLVPQGSSASAPAPASSPTPAAAPAKSAEAAFMQENMVAMDRMMADMNVPSSGNIDRDFTRMMIPHHQGAIDMAEALLRYTRNEELKALARGIIAKQREEIAIMRRIGSEPAAAASAPPGHHHAMDHAMGGMH